MVGFSSLLLLLWVAIGCVSMGQAENSSACPTACVPDRHTANTSFHQFAFSGSVVDIFFVISGLKNYDFVDEGHFWVSLEAIRLLAARTSAGGAAEGWDTRIHILADNAKVLSSTMQLGPPFYAHDMATMRNLSQPFFETYQRVHDSVNTLEYEFLCFNRWHLMQHIVSTSPFAMRRLLSLDLDVLLLVNASQLVDRVLHALRYRSEEDFDVVVLGLGAITLFSADGLRAFSGYMSRYFARPVEEVAKAIKRYMHFFSDMMMMKEFLLDASASSVQRKNACFELWRASDYYTHWKPQPNNACLLEMLQCVPMNGYREMLTHDNQLSLRSGPDQQVLLQGSRETLPYCLIVSPSVAHVRA